MFAEGYPKHEMPVQTMPKSPTIPHGVSGAPPLIFFIPLRPEGSFLFKHRCTW